MLHHDTSRHILIIEDLGDLQTLDNWLQTSDLTSSTVSVVGSRLGSFLADFHLATTPANRSSLREQLKNKNTIDVVYSHAVEPILSILNDYNIPDAQLVYEIVKTDFHHARQGSDYDSVNLGDLWTGSILLDKRGTKVGIIDWEFATVAPPSQDIGQFGIVW